MTVLALLLNLASPAISVALADETTPESSASSSITPIASLSPSPSPTEDPSPITDPSPTVQPSPSVEPILVPSTDEATPSDTTLEPNNSPIPSETPSPLASDQPQLPQSSPSPTPSSPETTVSVENTTAQGQISAYVVHAAPQAALKLDFSTPGQVGSASLTTNKADYSPTDSAVISGSGFIPNTTYILDISSTDPPPVDTQVQVITDQHGSFSYTYQLDGNYRPNYTVKIEDTAGNIVTTTTFTDSAAADAGTSTVIASPTTITADGVTTSTITVTLNKTNGSNAGSGKVVTLAKTSGSGNPIITTVSGTTNTSGQATFTVKSTTAANDSFTATDTTDSNLVITQTASVIFTAGVLDHINVTPTGVQTVASGSTIQFSAQGFDVNNNPISSLTFTWAVVSGTGTGSVNSSGLFTGINGGSATVTATSGGKTGSSGTITITKLNQSITFNPLSNKTYGDPDFSISAIASSGLAVSSSSLTTSVCTISGSIIHIVTAGSCTIRATQAGNSNYNPALNVDQSFTVNPLAITLTGTRPYDGTTNAAFGILSVSNKVGSDDVTVASGTGTLASANAGSQSISLFGTLALGGTTAGNYTLTGASGSVVISKIDQVILTVVDPSPVTYGTTATLSTTGGSGTGAVIFDAGSSTGCTISGTTLSVTDVGGTCNVTATKAADTNYNVVTSEVLSATLTRASSTTVVTCPVSQTFTGFELTPCTVAVTGPGGLSLTPDPIYTNNVNVGTASASYTFGGDNNHTGSFDSKTFAINLPTMTGAVSISGTAKFGQLLTADPTLLVNAGTPTYQWNRAGTPIGGATASTYTLVSGDIGSTITVTATADGIVGTGSITSSETPAVGKADGPSAPSAPTLSSKTATSVTLTTNALNQFSKDGFTWQDSNIFTGLTALTSYTFVTRVKATATTNESSVSDGTSITTNALSSAKAITAFSFSTGTGVIDETGHTISVNVPYGTDVTALVATFTTTGVGVSIGGTSQVSAATANDFTTAKTYTVTAENGITQDYVVTVTILAADQTAPSETGSATVNSTTPKVVITNPTQLVNLTIDSGTTDPKIDVSAFITGGTGSIPQITINSTAGSGNAAAATISIPATTVTSADSTWNGVIAAPTVTTVDLPVTSGETKTLGTAIEVGFTSAKLSFDKAVKIVLPGQSGKRAGYSRPGIDFTEITNTCASPSDQTTVDNDFSSRSIEDCKIDVGSDLVIWTKHFTTFVTYTQTSNTGGSSSQGLSEAGTPSCNDTTPGTPTLFSAVANGDNAVTLTWSKASGSVSYYLVTYGTSSGSQQYGNPNVGGSNTTSYTVSGLSGGVTYYFRVRAGNGCAPGAYSNELSSRAAGGVVTTPAQGFTQGVLGTSTSPSGANASGNGFSNGQVEGTASAQPSLSDNTFPSAPPAASSSTLSKKAIAAIAVAILLSGAGLAFYLKRPKKPIY